MGAVVVKSLQKCSGHHRPSDAVMTEGELKWRRERREIGALPEMGETSSNNRFACFFFFLNFSFMI